MTDEKLKVVILDGAFDEADLTVEEQEDLIEQLQQMVQDGTLFEHSKPVDLDELAEEDPELYSIIQSQLNTIKPPTLH